MQHHMVDRKALIVVGMMMMNAFALMLMFLMVVSVADREADADEMALCGNLWFPN